jgi:hypothetical protein
MIYQLHHVRHNIKASGVVAVKATCRARQNKSFHLPVQATTRAVSITLKRAQTPAGGMDGGGEALLDLEFKFKLNRYVVSCIEECQMLAGEMDGGGKAVLDLEFKSKLNSYIISCIEECHMLAGGMDGER